MTVIPSDPLIDEVAHSELVHDGARESILKVLKGRGFEFGVEVGVQYGQGSEKWLDNNVVFRMYGVDPYKTEVGQISPLQNRDTDTYGFAMGKLSRFGDRYVHIKKTSVEAIIDVPGMVDFVYLDAGKDKKSVIDDITYWYPKIKVGGVMFGHDYDHVSYPHMTGIVDEYFGHKPNVEEGGIWWVEKKDIKKEPKVSVVTPFYNTGYLAHQILECIEDERIDEMIIVDDCSLEGEAEMLKMEIAKHPKVKYFRNEKNQGELKTRIRGTELAKNDWVIFLDGDNSLTESYLDEIYRIPQWRSDVIYCPDFGNIKHINYIPLAGNYINKESIKPLLNNSLYLMSMFLNTGNYFMHRQSYLETAIPLQGIPKHEYGDIIIAESWLDAGHYFFVVDGMRYVHRRRKNSVWREHAKEMQTHINRILLKFK
jgi:hypothetical protein